MQPIDAARKPLTLGRYFAIRPPGPPPGPAIIFGNFARSSPKIAVQNSPTGKNIDIIYEDDKKKTGKVLPSALQPGSTAVFNVLPNLGLAPSRHRQPS
ncbi:hypothetical protein ABIE89_007532 [Bradyrhizobium niftali]